MLLAIEIDEGVKEFISKSASYYNSLDPTGADDSVQEFIRPRFLQMVVLLLSLAEMKDFLEATYYLKADRRDIELMILRVIPVLSINPRVLLNALAPVIDNFPLEEGSADKDDAHSNIWNIFVKRILADIYLLPATVKHLGHRHLSWIVKWPDHGFKSTTIFDTLQYVGSLSTVKDMPPLEVHPGSDCTELIVVMTDGSKYVIKPGDLDNIIYRTPGVYPMQETIVRKRCYDLMIQEVLLNGELDQANEKANEIVQKVNQWLANPNRGAL